MVKRLIISVLMFSLMVLTGCSGLAKLSLFNKISEQEIQAKFADQSIQDVITGLEQKMASAEKENIKYYSPQNFKTAKKLFAKLGKERVNKEKKITLFRTAYKLDNQLELGILTKKKIIEELQMAFELKKSLQNREAEKTFLSRYNKVDEQLRELISDIEEGNKNKVTKKKLSLISKMQTLELDTIKFNSLHQAEIIFNKAKKLDSAKIAPITHKSAQEALEYAHKSIHLTPYDVKMVDKVSQKFTFAAQHLLHVTEEVHRLRKLDKKQFESVVLDEEQRLYAISQALNHRDSRNVSIKLQAESLTQVIKNRSQQFDRIENEKESLVKSDGQLRNTLQDLKRLQHEINTSVQEKQALKATNLEMEKEVLILQNKIGNLEKQVLILQNSRLVNTKVGPDGNIIVPGNNIRKNDPLLNQDNVIPQLDKENQDKQSKNNMGIKNDSRVKMSYA